MLGLGLSIGAAATRSTGVPVPPPGFAFLIYSDGAYAVDATGALIIVEVK